jgi:hypothetical protein
MYPLKRMKVSLYAITLASLLSLSCTSDHPIQYEGSLMPIVTGIRVTAAESPKQIAVWGNPGYADPNAPSGSIIKLLGDTVKPLPGATGFEMDNPYPNPAKGSLTIRFSLPVAKRTRIWVTTAQLQGSLDITSFAGAITPSPESRSITTLLDDVREAGNWELEWQFLDNKGNRVLPGFYRIYLQYDDKILSRDVLVYANELELPSTLRELMP